MASSTLRLPHCISGWKQLSVPPTAAASEQLQPDTATELSSTPSWENWLSGERGPKHGGSPCRSRPAGAAEARRGGQRRGARCGARAGTPRTQAAPRHSARSGTRARGHTRRTLTHARARARPGSGGGAPAAHARCGARPHGGGGGGRRSAALCPRRRAQRGGGGTGARAGRRRRAGAGGRGGGRRCSGRGAGRAAGRVSPGDGAAAAAGPAGRRAARPHGHPAHGHAQAHTCRYERGAPASPLLRPTHPGAALAASPARANFPRAPPPLWNAAAAARTSRAEVRSRPVPSRGAPGRSRAARSGAEGRAPAGAAGATVATAAARCSGASAALAGTAGNWVGTVKQSDGFATRILRHRGGGRVSEPFSFTFLLCPPQRWVAAGAGARMQQQHLRDCPPLMPAGPLPAAAPGPAEPVVLPGAPGGRGAAPPAAARWQRRAADGPRGEPAALPRPGPGGSGPGGGGGGETAASRGE
ncbi:uncharacterized protein [Taeniopygia guttata]|uniref:uncharacterized protein n=1 Tax=Taeniopygia guttata TaxID=59729 RepID=UPI003BB89FFD